MYRICRSIILSMFIFVVLSGMVHAIPFTFNPANPTETNNLSDVFDDDVDVYSGQEVPQILVAGDTITWDYNYQTMYKVLSGDQADIEELRLFGTTLGGSPSVNVSLQFTDPEHNLIGQAYNFNNIGWGANNVLVSNANDVLGNLQGLVIGDFHLQATMLAGSVGFTGVRFNWEAGDIEAVVPGPEPGPIPEPSTIFLLGSSLIGLTVWKGFKNQKTKKTHAQITA